MVGTGSQGCLDVVLGKAMSNSLEVWTDFEKMPKCDFLENERTMVSAVLDGCH
jgi:hypothetical protein